MGIYSQSEVSVHHCSKGQGCITKKQIQLLQRKEEEYIFMIRAILSATFSHMNSEVNPVYLSTIQV